MIKKWKTLAREIVAKTPIFELQSIRRDPPFDSAPSNFFVVDLASWVNVFAYTSTGDLVMIRQYRQGTDSITLEVPGGAIDAGEDPLAAAKRELAEETGYVSERWAHLGVVEVNPAIQTNSCHTFIALDCRLEVEPHLDEYEDIEVALFPHAKLGELIGRREITHSLVVAGAFYVGEYLKSHPEFEQ